MPRRGRRTSRPRRRSGPSRWRARRVRRSTSCTSPAPRRWRPSRDAQAAGLPVFAETCPHYLTLDASRYDLPADEAAKYVISPPLRAPGQADALWAGLADGALALVGTDHVPDRVAVEKQSWRESFDRISNGGPGIETLLTLVYSEGVARGRITLERMVDLLATTPARLFGLRGKGAVEVGRDADLVLFDPVGAARHPPGGPAPHERLHAVRGSRGGRRRALGRRARHLGRARRRLRRPPRPRAIRRAPARRAGLSTADDRLRSRPGNDGRLACRSGDTTRHRVVIVGGGFGGLYAAKGLGGDARVQVTLVDRRNFHLFQPLLYQVATGALSPGEIAQPLRSILRRRAEHDRAARRGARASTRSGVRSSSRTAGRSTTTPSSSPPAPASPTSGMTRGRPSRRASSPSMTRSRSAAGSSSPSRPRSARRTRCAARSG